MSLEFGLYHAPTALADGREAIVCTLLSISLVSIGDRSVFSVSKGIYMSEGPYQRSNAVQKAMTKT